MQPSNNLLNGILLALTVLGGCSDPSAHHKERALAPSIGPTIILGKEAHAWHCKTAHQGDWECLIEPKKHSDQKETRKQNDPVSVLLPKKTTSASVLGASLATYDTQKHLFTIQVMAANHQARLEKLQQHDPILKEGRIISSDQDGHRIYRLIWGNYFTKNAAQAAMRNELTPYVLALKPWVRAITSVSETAALRLHQIQ